jgi:hypothetical protein
MILLFATCPLTLKKDCIGLATLLVAIVRGEAAFRDFIIDSRWMRVQAVQM